MTTHEDEQLERDARTALEEGYGRPHSDEEWAKATHRPLDLVHILRDCEHQREEPHGA